MIDGSFLGLFQFTTDYSHRGTLQFLVQNQNCPFCWRSEPACGSFAFWGLKLKSQIYVSKVKYCSLIFFLPLMTTFIYSFLSSWPFTFLLAAVYHFLLLFSPLFLSESNSPLKRVSLFFLFWQLSCGTFLLFPVQNCKYKIEKHLPLFYVDFPTIW